MKIYAFTRIPSVMCALCCVAPMILYFLVIGKYAVNIPSQDDYAAILDFLCQYKTAAGTEKICMLLHQHGEHRILSSRVIYVLYYSLAGNINFRDIIFIGNLQLVLANGLLVLFIKQALPRYWLIAALVMSISLFDLNNWENADFAMACVQNYGVIFLFLSSLYLYNTRNGLLIFPALLLQIVCMYSSGNGIVAAAFIVLFNIVNKDKLKAGTSLAVFLVFAPLYFWHYVTPSTSQDRSDLLTIINYFFRFISNHIYYGDSILSFSVGVLILAGLCYLGISLRKQLTERRLLPLICLAAFLITSMLLTAIFRSHLGDYIPSRYLVYPNLLIALLLIFLLLKLEHTKAFIPVAVSFTLLMLIAYNMNFHSGIKAFAKLNNTLTTTPYYYPDTAIAKTIADRTCQLKIYCIEEHR